MLTHITIENIAVIEKVEVDFYNGLNVLTGETGAGKSIIIDAIGMLLGQRTLRDLIRSGETRARVSAIFYVSDVVWEYIELQGIEKSEDNSLLLFREINADGRGVCKINGMLTNVSILKEIGKFLINIHGQQDTTQLYSPENHINLLDEWAGEKITRYKSQYLECYNEYKELSKELKSLRENEKTRQTDIDILEYQIQEIESANLKIGEEEQIDKRLEVLSNAERLSRVLGKAHSMIISSSENVRDILNAVTKDIGEISRIDTKIEEMYVELNDISYRTEDVGINISEYIDNIDYSQRELEELNVRSEQIRQLQRKYGADIQSILEYLNVSVKKLEFLKNSKERADVIDSKLKQSSTRLKESATKLTKLREEFSIILSKEIEKELQELNMQGAVFKVSIKVSVPYTKRGKDEVEFLISPNIGEELKPLTKIASGGELSRIMLAIKCIMAKCDINETYVFDEIDTGVSGRAAEKVAEKLIQVAKHKQTIIVTHSTHIASIAEHHYLIDKQVSGNRTKTELIYLDEAGRIEEIARINSGSKLTEVALLHARELLQIGEKKRS